MPSWIVCDRCGRMIIDSCRWKCVTPGCFDYDLCDQCRHLYLKGDKCHPKGHNFISVAIESTINDTSTDPVGQPVDLCPRCNGSGRRGKIFTKCSVCMGSGRVTATQNSRSYGFNVDLATPSRMSILGLL